MQQYIFVIYVMLIYVMLIFRFFLTKFYLILYIFQHNVVDGFVSIYFRTNIKEERKKIRLFTTTTDRRKRTMIVDVFQEEIRRYKSNTKTNLLEF